MEKETSVRNALVFLEERGKKYIKYLQISAIVLLSFFSLLLLNISFFVSLITTLVMLPILFTVSEHFRKKDSITQINELANQLTREANEEDNNNKRIIGNLLRMNYLLMFSGRQKYIPEIHKANYEMFLEISKLSTGNKEDISSPQVSTKQTPSQSSNKEEGIRF